MRFGAGTRAACRPDGVHAVDARAVAHRLRVRAARPWWRRCSRPRRRARPRGRTGGRRRRRRWWRSPPTSTWPARVAPLAKIVWLAHQAVVGDVGVGHEQVVGADAGQRRRRPPCRGGWSRTRGSRCGRRSRGAWARRGTSGPAARRPDRAEREEVVVRADRGVAVDHDVGLEHGARADAHLAARRRSRGRRARPAPSTAPGRHPRGGVHVGRGQRRRPAAAGSPRPRGARRSAPRPARGTARPRRCRTLHLEAELVAGHGGPAELGVVDADDVDLEPAAGRARPSAARCPAAWARLSMSSTPGITGAPGKWPSKNSSEPVTFLMATSRPAGSCSSTRSTSTNGYWRGDLADEPADVDRTVIDGAARGARPLRAFGGRPPARGAGDRAPRLRLGRGGSGRASPPAARPAFAVFSAVVGLGDHVAGDVELPVDGERDLAVEQDVDPLLLGHRLDVGLDLRLELAVAALRPAAGRAPSCRCSSCWPSSRKAWRSRVFLMMLLALLVGAPPALSTEPCFSSSSCRALIAASSFCSSVCFLVPSASISFFSASSCAA